MKCDILVNGELKASYSIVDRDFIAGVTWMREPTPVLDRMPGPIRRALCRLTRLLGRNAGQQILLVAGFTGGRERRILGIPIWMGEPEQRLTGLSLQNGDTVRIRVVRS